jgi:hypothetical protein
MAHSPLASISRVIDYYDAIVEVLDRARSIKLPGVRFDVVTIVEREFAKRGCCDSKFIEPIELQYEAP